MPTKLTLITESGDCPENTPALSVAGAADAVPVPWECHPAEEDISRLAYSYWEARACDGQTGSAEDDWLRAEQELRRRMEAEPAAA